MAPVSLRTEDMIEGGDFPRGHLIITKARYLVYQYMKAGKPVIDNRNNPAQAVGVLLWMRHDTGTDFQQFYSIGDPAKYTILETEPMQVSDEYPTGQCGSLLDGTTGIPKTSNFATLLNELETKGYPQNQVGDNVATMMESVYANWDSVQQQSRAGLENQGGGQRVVVVPVEIFQFPWGPARPNAPQYTGQGSRETQTITSGDVGQISAAQVQPQAPVQQPTSSPSAIVNIAVGLVEGLLNNGGSPERKDLSMEAFAYNNNPANAISPEDAGALMTVLFDDSLVQALAAKGITMQGEAYVRA